VTAFVALLAFVAVPVGSQEKPDVLPPAVSTTVLVDVVVRDKKDQAVTGLVAADFEVLEDGVPQRIEQFSLAGAAARAAPGSSPGALGATQDSGLSPSSAAPTAAPSTASEPVTIAFVFDRLSTEGRVAAQRAARQFMEARQLGAVAGVFSVEDTLVVLQDFTPDPSLVLAALDTLGTRVAHAGTSVADQTRGATRQRIVPNAAAARLARMPEPSNAAQAVTRAQAMIQATQLSMAQAAEDAFERLDRDQHGFTAASALTAIVDALRAIPARKAVVLFSEGLFKTEANEGRFLSVVHAANRASVSVYAAEASGLKTQSLESLTRDEIESTADVRLAQQNSGRDTGGGAFTRGLERTETLVKYNPRASLEWLSDSTGGFFVRDTNDFSDSLDRIGSDLRSYYLIGYTPTNETYDGRFRKIAVKVRKPGLTVRARSGYFAVRTVGPVLTHVAPALALLESGKRPHAFDVFIGAWPFPDGQDTARVPVVVSVPGRALATLSQRKKEAGFDLTLLARIRDASGNPVEAMSRRFMLDVTAARQALDGDLRLLRDAWLPPGRYTLEAAASEGTTGQASVTTLAFEVPGGSGPLDRAQVVVIRQALPAAKAAPEIEDGHPLRFGDALLQPLAGEPYPHQSGRLVVQVTASPSAGTSPPAAVIGLWQGERRLAQRTVVWGRPELSGLVRHVEELPMADLGAGKYDVRVELSEAGRERRLGVPFVVSE